MNQFTRHKGGFFLWQKTMKNNRYSMTILSPAGNNTALVNGNFSKTNRKVINDFIMKKNPTVEQVGFYTYSPNKRQATLIMAGGEFCGNATRSLAYLLLNKVSGNMSINIPSIKRVLDTGVDNNLNAYAQIPIYKKFKTISQIEKDLYKVPLLGITHLITPLPNKKSQDNLKRIAYALLKKNGLLTSLPASGVVFWSKKGNNFTIDPVVWVRDIKTFFYETACASGTAAFGLWIAKRNSLRKTYLKILQPSGKYICVSVLKTQKKFIDAVIRGPIEILQKGEIEYE